MNVYDEFYPVAVELLEEFGTMATLNSTAPAAASLEAKRAGRALATSGQPAGRPTLAALTPMQVAGDNGRTETRSVATMLLEPREGDTLTIGTAKPLTIGAITRVAPQGKAIVFIAEVS